MKSSISCQVCQDLIPLVRDQVASEDSTALVKAHVCQCETCRQLLEEGQPPCAPPPDDHQVLSRLKNRLYALGLFFLIFGIGLGIFFTNSAGMFYNFAIMPVAGGLGYLLLRKKWWLVPSCIAVLTCLFTTVSLLWEGEENLAALLSSGMIYAGIYAFLALLGSAAAALLCFAFGKEELS